jgi:hypothetical protein
MKRITLATVAAAFAAFTISTGAATTGSQATASNVQGCPAAPAIANAYLIRANLSRPLHQGRSIQASTIDLFAARLSLMVS